VSIVIATIVSSGDFYTLPQHWVSNTTVIKVEMVPPSPPTSRLFIDDALNVARPLPKLSGRKPQPSYVDLDRHARRRMRGLA
jgi:hypothetical protein